MKPVDSTSISHVGHDPATRVLSVKFASGQTYNYANVSAEAHAALLGADSIGSHFQANIRPKFRAKKI